jgi:hypothetical protein
MDAQIYLLEGGACTTKPARCLSAADAELDGLNEWVEWYNDSFEPKTIYIVVDSYSSDESGRFNLQTDIY